MKKLLKLGLLLMSVASLSIIWIRISAGDVNPMPSYEFRNPVLVENRNYQLLAEILPGLQSGDSHPPAFANNKGSVHGASDCKGKNNRQEDCEVMHLVITSWGTNVTRNTALLLKSVFLYRRSPLHLHILADEIATVILAELLRSWGLFKVSVTFYNLKELQAGYALEGFLEPTETRLFLQLALPSILPAEVTKVLILNSDRMLAADIGELWSVFSRFSHSQSIGVVAWPRNTTASIGVMLMHVAKLRGSTWAKNVDVLKKEALRLSLTGAAVEQAAADLLVELFSDFVYILPCQYNHPTVDTAELCSASSIKQVKVIEFSGDRVPALFWKTFLKVVRFDGNLLRKPRGYACSTAADDDDDGSQLDNTRNAQQMKLVDSFGNNICKDYVREFIGTFRTHLFYLGSYTGVNADFDVTLVTQLSINRMNSLERLCSQWRGPMSIAIYLSDSDTLHLLSYIQSSKVFASRNNIVFHLLFEEGSLYPTNHLRNTAVSQVKTSHVFVLDVDFMPDPLVYDHVRKAIKLDRLKAEALTLLLPAFETDDYSLAFPETKQKIIPLLDNGVVYPFRNKTFARGHLATNYTLWKNTSEPYKISWEEGFEPYFVMRTAELPKYRETFMGYGMNKIVHIMEVAAQGFSFLVMPDSFVLHLPHAETFERVRHSSSSEIIQCMILLEEDVARELLKKHGNDALKGWRPKKLTLRSTQKVPTVQRRRGLTSPPPR